MDMSIFDKLYDKALDEPEGSVKRKVAVALSGAADWFGATADELRGHREGLRSGADQDPRAEPADYTLYTAGTIGADMKEYLLARMAARRNLLVPGYLIAADYVTRVGNMAIEYIRRRRAGEDTSLGEIPPVGLVGTARALVGKLRGGHSTTAQAGADDDDDAPFSILPAKEPLHPGTPEEGPLHDYTVNPDGTTSEIVLTEQSDEDAAAEDAKVQRLLERVLDEDIPFEGSGEAKAIESQFYSLTMPAGWDYVVEEGTLFLFTAENTYAAVFAVGLSPEEKAQVSIEGFLGEDSVPAGEEALTPFSRERTLLAGYEAARIDLAGTVDGKPVRTVQWYAIAGDVMYALTFSTREHLYGKYAPAFDAIVASFAPVVKQDIEGIFSAAGEGQAAGADLQPDEGSVDDLFPGEDAPSKTPSAPPEGDGGDDLF